jgi:pimeloyl-ACP methyl ester carboxylesterase
MAWADNGTIRLYFEARGDAADPVLLLISGLGSQYNSFPDDWCDLFVDEGFYVVRFDHRDAGLSTSFDASPPDVAAVTRARLEGRPPTVPYTLSDMATDALAVLDAVNAERAHVMGVSMGAQIGQLLAIEHPQRVLSLVSALSRTGDADVGQPSPEARRLEAQRLEKHRLEKQRVEKQRVAKQWLERSSTTRAEAVADYQAGLEVWGSPAFYDPERAAVWAGAAFDRNFNPDGRARQLMAIIAAPSRTAALGSVTVPTLVIHGTADKLVDPSGGRRTADAIPGARLVLIDGMGHDYPPELWPRLTELVAAHAHGAARMLEDQRGNRP